MASPQPIVSSGILTDALGLLDQYTNTFVFDVYSNTFGPGTRFSSVLTGTLILYVAIYGLQIAMGRTTLTIGEFGPRVLKIGFIIALLTVWGTFQRLVVDVAFDAPRDLASEILSSVRTYTGNETGVVKAIEDFYDRMIDAANACMRNASITSAHLYIAAFFIWLVTILVMYFAFGYMLLSHLAIALILAVGPLFISLFLFGGTRGIFEGWLRSLLTFALIPLFLLTSLALLLAMVGGVVATVHAQAMAGAPTWEAILMLVVFTFSFALLFVQIPNITASIAGGVSLSGIANTMAAVGFSGARTALSGGKLVGRAATLAYAVRSPAERARTIDELHAARRRVSAGIGEQARWWNRLGTTPGMRNSRSTRIALDANHGVRPVDLAKASSTGRLPSRGPDYGR